LRSLEEHSHHARRIIVGLFRVWPTVPLARGRECLAGRRCKLLFPAPPINDHRDHHDGSDRAQNYCGVGELRFKITDATGLLTDSSFECFLGRGRFGAGLGCRRRKLRFCGGRPGPSHNQSRARRCQDACLHGRSRVSHVFAANGKPSKGPKFPDGAWPSQRIGAKRHCPCMLRLAAGGGRRVYLRLKRLPAATSRRQGRASPSRWHVTLCSLRLARHIS
jgi:hypothetical protein